MAIGRDQSGYIRKCIERYRSMISHNELMH